MKKAVVLALSAVLCLSNITAATAEGNLITNGDLSAGADKFGICYSSREDTVMPSIRRSESVFKDGETLEFLPGADLGNASSASLQSMGFAYQGIMHGNTFDLLDGTKYNLSVDAYAIGSNVKMRFVIIEDGKAVDASDEIAVASGKWGKYTYSFTPNSDMDNVRVRLAFYNIELGRSVYIDNLSCKEVALSNKSWKASANEVITLSGRDLSFATPAGQEAEIYSIAGLDVFTPGEKYALVATATTTAPKAYISLINGKDSADYLVTSGDNIQMYLPFEMTETDLKLQVRALTEVAASVTLQNIAVVDMYQYVNVTTNGNTITASGYLRSGNENKNISISMVDDGGVPLFTPAASVVTNENGYYTYSYTILADIPDTIAQLKIRVTVEDIAGYADMGGLISADGFITNSAYADRIVAELNATTNASSVLTDDVLDGLGVATDPVVRGADKADIMAYVSGKNIANSDALINTILTGAALSTLDNKTEPLSNVTDNYGTLLAAAAVGTYNDIYAGADKTKLDEMFNQSTAPITDIASYQYALSEVLVRYAMQSKDTSDKQMALLQKYDTELGLNFTAYNTLSSASKHSVAADLLANIQTTTSYSLLQSQLDILVAAARTLENNSNGGGGSSGGSSGTFGGGAMASPSVKPTAYEFIDIAGYAWAKPAIEALLAKDVISQAADKKFNPGNNVTRAELVKMASVLFGYSEYVGTDAKFGDVNPTDWYYKYVMALYNAGVISGLSDTEFGSNNPITRQDICVILSNILKQEPTEGEAEFTDIADASDYAKKAIKLMKELNVINGYEDGSFRPKAFATRAEIAQILYTIGNR